MIGSSVLWDQGILPLLIIATLKGTIMLAAAGMACVMLKSNSAAVRHLLWCTALFSLPIFLAGANGLERWQVPVLPAALVSAPETIANVRAIDEASSEVPSAVSAVTGESAAPAELQAGSVSVSWESVVLGVWVLGMLLVIARLVVGTIRVRRLVLKATPFTDASWGTLAAGLSQQIKLRGRVRVLRSTESVMPMTCGALSPVVLLPKEADEWAVDRRRVVLLHELIHVKRRDLLTQTVAQLVCAIYWFNPLVWFAIGQLRKEQEWACDERVLASGVRASDYAGHLFDLGRRFSTREVPALTTTAIVRCSQLEQRLRAILKPALRGPSSARMKTASMSVLCVVFVLVAGTQLVGNERITSSPVPLKTASQPGEQPIAAQEQDPQAAPKQSPRQTPSPSPSPQAAVSPSPETGDDQMAEEVFNSFSAEERNRLMNNGIGPAYIREMAGAGYRKLTANELIALFSNSVRANYVASLESVGYRNLSLRDILALRTNGITADVIKSFQAVKYGRDFDAVVYIAFRSNSVPPSYLKSMSALGYDKMTPKQIVDMWVAGVTADFVRDAKNRSQSSPAPEELIELKKREKP